MVQCLEMQYLIYDTDMKFCKENLYPQKVIISFDSIDVYI